MCIQWLLGTITGEWGELPHLGYIGIKVFQARVVFWRFSNLK